MKFENLQKILTTEKNILKKIEINKEDQILNLIVRNFSVFGGGKLSPWGNLLAEALKDRLPSFAAGVDVRQIVRFLKCKNARIPKKGLCFFCAHELKKRKIMVKL